MDQGRQEETCSPDPRSITSNGSGVSTYGFFQGLSSHIIDYPPATHTLRLKPTRPTNKTPGPGTASSTYINTLSSSQTSLSCPPTPVFQPQASPFPTLSEHILHSHWLDITSRPELEGTPALRIDSAPDYRRHISPPSPSTHSETASMSTAALQFDPGFSHFSMGSRSSFAWPGMSSHQAAQAGSMKMILTEQ